MDVFSPFIFGLSLGMLVAALWARAVKSARSVFLLALIPALNTLVLLAWQGVAHLEYLRVTWIPPPALEGVVAQERAVDTRMSLCMGTTLVLLLFGVIANGVRLLRAFTMRQRPQT